MRTPAPQAPWRFHYNLLSCAGTVLIDNITLREPRKVIGAGQEKKEEKSDRYH